MTNLYSLGINLPLSSQEGSPPFPVFQSWKQINIHEAFATLFGGRGALQMKKSVFFQIQNTIVSLKALVSVVSQHFCPSLLA